MFNKADLEECPECHGTGFKYKQPVILDMKDYPRDAEYCDKCGGYRFIMKTYDILKQAIRNIY